MVNGARCAANRGSSKTKLWNSPFSPHGSTSRGRSARKASSISLPAKEAAQIFRVHAYYHRFKAGCNEVPDQRCTVLLPEREHPFHACLRQLVFAVGPRRSSRKMSPNTACRIPAAWNSVQRFAHDMAVILHGRMFRHGMLLRAAPFAGLARPAALPLPRIDTRRNAPLNVVNKCFTRIRAFCRSRCQREQKAASLPPLQLIYASMLT